MPLVVKPTFTGKVIQLEISGANGPATIDWDDPFDAVNTTVPAPGGIRSHDYGAGAAGSAFITVTDGARVANINGGLSDFWVMTRDQVTAWIEGENAEMPLDPSWWVLLVYVMKEDRTLLCYGHPISFISSVNARKSVMASIPPTTYDDPVVVP